MSKIIIDDMQTGYEQIIRHVQYWGEEVSPRGQKTREVMGATIVLQDPTRALPVGINRKLNVGIAAVEAAQLIGGVSHPEIIERVAPNMMQFRDGGTFHGAYGPRLRAQLPVVLNRIMQDPDTRQAIVTIWDPAHDAHIEGLHDYPCTISLQFFVRDKKLVMHTHMRSNDVWWGLAYDAFQFTQLQLCIAWQLGIEPGAYYHHANSLHVYARDYDAIEQLTDWDGTNTGPRVHFANFDRARDILAGCAPLTDSEVWYHEALDL